MYRVKFSALLFLSVFINVFSMHDNVDSSVSDELKSLEFIIDTHDSLDELYEAFTISVIEDKKEVAELFLKKGFDAHKIINCTSGFNVFMYALAYCHEDIIKSILQNCSVEDVNRQSSHGDTSLMIMGMYKEIQQKISDEEKIKIINLLLCKGANINIQNKDKNNILFKYHQSEAILETCIQNSRLPIDFELIDKKGRTVLMLVAEKNDAIVLRLLLASGAKWDAKNSFGELAIDKTGRSCKPLLKDICDFFDIKTKNHAQLINKNKNNLWFLVPVLKTAAMMKNSKGCAYYKKLLDIHFALNPEIIHDLLLKRRFTPEEYKNMSLLGVFYDQEEINMKSRLYKANNTNFSYIPTDININYLKY